TYPLPEAQLDRFLVRLGVGYPSREQERLMLERRQLRGADEPQLDQVLQLDKLLEMQAALEEVHIDPDIQFYIVDLVEATRQHPGVQVGASPRGSLALLKLARAKAALGGRDFVTPEDVKGVAGPALAHRLSLRPELWVQRVSPDDIIRECLEQTPTPPTRQAAPLGRSAAG
ncbi:MAG: AAA family ATPase, partial [Candidatus Dormibacteria bacterium]